MAGLYYDGNGRLVNREKGKPRPKETYRTFRRNAPKRARAARNQTKGKGK